MTRAVRRGTRRLVTTVTGSRYAFAQALDGRWWVRARAKRARGSTTTLPDMWRPIARPVPWPPRSGYGMVVEFVDVRPVHLTSGRVILMGGAYRQTSSVQRIASWDPRAAWPGPLPEDVEVTP